MISDKPECPYVPMKDLEYLPANKPTLNGTLWVDNDGNPYLVYFLRMAAKLEWHNRKN